MGWGEHGPTREEQLEKELIEAREQRADAIDRARRWRDVFSDNKTVVSLVDDVLAALKANEG